MQDGKAVPIDHPLSFAKCDKELCFNRIRPELRMPEKNMHFPTGDLEAYSKTYDQFTCVLMQGGQGDTKHWAFNDPVKREGKYADNPPSPEEYRKFATRIVDLHPITVMQNARTSGGGNIALVPTKGGGEALTYEFFGTKGDDKYFVYVDAESGEEMKIMRVLDGERGLLLQ